MARALPTEVRCPTEEHCHHHEALEAWARRPAAVHTGPPITTSAIATARKTPTPMKNDEAEKIARAVLLLEDSRIREDDERERRPQQLGTEDGGPIEDVEGLQLRGDGLDP